MKLFWIIRLFVTLFADTYYLENVDDGIYMCNTYCFTYAKNKISLDKFLCDNIYVMSSIDEGRESRIFDITNTSCNKLYEMSLNDKIYRYTNPPYIEKFCEAKIINCNAQCNPYRLNCTIDYNILKQSE